MQATPCRPRSKALVDRVRDLKIQSRILHIGDSRLARREGLVGKKRIHRARINSGQDCVCIIRDIPTIRNAVFRVATPVEIIDGNIAARSDRRNHIASAFGLGDALDHEVLDAGDVFANREEHRTHASVVLVEIRLAIADSVWIWRDS